MKRASWSSRNKTILNLSNDNNLCIYSSITIYHNIKQNISNRCKCKCMKIKMISEFLDKKQLNAAEFNDREQGFEAKKLNITVKQLQIEAISP